MQQIRGMTVIDLMITLSVAAVLVTLGFPSLTDLVRQNRLTAATNELVATLNFARMQSVSGLGRVMVCPSTDAATCTGGNRWDQGWIVFIDRDHSGQPTDPGDLLRVGMPLAHVFSDSGGRTRVRYKPDGTAFGFNITIKLCDREKPELSRAVIVSNPGRVRSGPLPAHLSCTA